MSSSKRRIGTQYGLAIVSVAVVALVQWMLQPALADAAPLILFVLPIVAAGWYGGIGPALLATALGTLSGAYLEHHGFSLQLKGDYDSTAIILEKLQRTDSAQQ